MPVELDHAPSGDHPDSRTVWLRWALLCDGQRREDNGKRLLLGVYDHTIVAARKPAFLAPRLVGAFEFVKPGKHTLHFRVEGPSTKGVGDLTSDEAIEAGGYVDFEVPVPTLLLEPGEIRLDWRIDDEPWGPAMVWKLEFADDAEELSPEQLQLIAAQFEASTDLSVKIGGHTPNMTTVFED